LPFLFGDSEISPSYLGQVPAFLALKLPGWSDFFTDVWRGSPAFLVLLLQLCTRPRDGTVDPPPLMLTPMWIFRCVASPEAVPEFGVERTFPLGAEGQFSDFPPL